MQTIFWENTLALSLVHKKHIKGRFSRYNFCVQLLHATDCVLCLCCHVFAFIFLSYDTTKTWKTGESNKENGGAHQIWYDFAKIVVRLKNMIQNATTLLELVQ